MESRTVGLSFVVFVIFFVTFKIVVIEKVSIIQGFVPFIDLPSREDKAMDQLNKSEINGDAIFNFFPNISSYVDILDTKLSDILSNVKRLGTTFAKAAMDIERPNNERSFKDLFLSMFSTKEDTTENLTATNLTKPLHILLLSTWSSGSTFLTKLLTHYPGTFLTFEPMVLIKGYGAVQNQTAAEARLLLKDVFNCNYEPGSMGEKLLGFTKRSAYTKWALHNIRLRNVCEGLKNGNNYCYDPAFVSNICRLHPIQLVKTVRLRVQHVQQLLEEDGINLKIIALFRDPRAVRSSRLGRSWCNFPSCNHLPIVCQDHNQDLRMAKMLSELNPDKVIIAKYEELATQPKLTIPVILKFLGLPWHPALTQFMSDHMVEDLKHNREGDLHTQSVNSSAKVNQWRVKLSHADLAEVTKTCERTIESHEKLSMINNSTSPNLKAKNPS